MNAHDYHFLLSERVTLNKLINQVSPSDVIGRMSLQVRLKEVEEGINQYIDCSSDCPLPLDLPAPKFEEIITKWIESYEIYEPAFNLYFASVSSGQKYLEWKFLSLVQGIETLHRRTSQEIEMPEEEFVKIKKNVLEVIPNEKQEWLAVRLKYANELSLRKRIEQMIKPFKDLFGNGRARDSFIRKVVDTRNYLTHYDSGLETKAASGEDLWRLCMKLEALFQLHFLRLIGMNTESIKSIVNKNSTLRDKIGLEYQELSEEST